MAEMDWELIPVHDFTDDYLVTELAQALNTQWSRSLTARYRLHRI